MPSFASTQNPSGRGAVNSGPRGGRYNNVEGVAVQNPIYIAGQRAGPSGGVPERDSSNGARGTGPNYNGPFFNSQKQKFLGSFSITGITRDNAGAALGSCRVELMRTGGDTFVAETISDGSGNFTLVTPNNSGTFYLVAYKVGSPDKAGTSVNTLTPVPVYG